MPTECRVIYLNVRTKPLGCDNVNPIPQEADRLKLEAEYFQMEELQQQLECSNKSNFLTQGMVNLQI